MPTTSQHMASRKKPQGSSRHQGKKRHAGIHKGCARLVRLLLVIPESWKSQMTLPEILSFKGKLAGMCRKKLLYFIVGLHFSMFVPLFCHLWSVMSTNISWWGPGGRGCSSLWCLGAFPKWVWLENGVYLLMAGHWRGKLMTNQWI